MDTIIDAMLTNSELSEVPLLILANKMDLEDAQTVNQIAGILAVERRQGAIASYPICATKRYAFLFMMCVSASVTIWMVQRREGIEEAMNWLVDAVKTSDRYIEKAATGST